MTGMVCPHYGKWNLTCIFLLFTILVITITFSCSDQKSLVFEKLHIPGSESTIDFYYLTIGYQDTPEDLARIDSFACAWYHERNHIQGQLFLSLFKKSKKTNQDYLSQWPREFYRYSAYNDLIFIYKWEINHDQGYRLSIRTKYAKNQIPIERIDFDCQR